MLQFVRHFFAAPDQVLPGPYWFDAYNRLNAAHDLELQCVSCHWFLQNPEHNEHWIKMYFMNPALFEGKVGLRFFLDNDPASILRALLNQGKRVPGELDKAVKPRRRLKRLRDDTFDGGKAFATVSMRGGRFIQPIKCWEPISKFHTCGGGRS